MESLVEHRVKEISTASAHTIVSLGVPAAPSYLMAASVMRGGSMTGCASVVTAKMDIAVASEIAVLMIQTVSSSIQRPVLTKSAARDSALTITVAMIQFASAA